MRIQTPTFAVILWEHDSPTEQSWTIEHVLVHEAADVVSHDSASGLPSAFAAVSC